MTKEDQDRADAEDAALAARAIARGELELLTAEQLAAYGRAAKAVGLSLD